MGIVTGKPRFALFKRIFLLSFLKERHKEWGYWGIMGLNELIPLRGRCTFQRSAYDEVELSFIEQFPFVTQEPEYFTGRQANIFYQGFSIGTFGIVHPEVRILGVFPAFCPYLKVCNDWYECQNTFSNERRHAKPPQTLRSKTSSTYLLAERWLIRAGFTTLWYPRSMFRHGARNWAIFVNLVYPILLYKTKRSETEFLSPKCHNGILWRTKWVLFSHRFFASYMMTWLHLIAFRGTFFRGS